MLKFILSKSKTIISGGLILTGSLLLMNCGGLVKLDISREAYQAENNWLIPYKNEQRHNAINNDVLPPYKIEWSRKYKSVITDHPLAVDKYVIFTVKSGMLAIIHSELGELLGDGKIAPGFYHSPVIENNILYSTANLGRETVFSFDLEKKDFGWKIRLPHINTTPLVTHNSIYAGANNGNFYALDKKTGNKKWEFSARHAIYGLPAMLDERIYFSNVKGTIFCLDAERGELLWERKLDENIYAGPLIANKRIIIGSAAGNLHCLSLNDGSSVWQNDTRSSIYGNASFKDNVIYVGNNGHKMLAVNLETGSVLWQFTTKGINNTAPLVGSRFLYFGSWDKNFYILNRHTGELVHKEDLESSIKSSPIIFNERIFVHVANKRLYCLTTDALAQK